MTIVVSPARGGGVSIGGNCVLFDGYYQETSGIQLATWQATSAGAVDVTADVIVSGPDDYTWLLSGAAADYEIYCQPTSGSFSSGSAATNTWLALSTTRIWKRSGSATVIATVTIRDIATQTTQATCTITLGA